MIQTKYLIIGGGVAGTTAAETIRQNDSEGRIIIVSDEPYRHYSGIKPVGLVGNNYNPAFGIVLTDRFGGRCSGHPSANDEIFCLNYVSIIIGSEGKIKTKFSF